MSQVGGRVACRGRRVVRRALSVAVAAALIVASVPSAAQQPPELPPDEVRKADQLREDLRRMTSLARDRVFPALVNISVITVRYFGGKEQKGRAVGSGTIISEDGYVLTNYHVAQNGRKFRVTLADKQEVTAELVGEDPLCDLAVLKLDLDELKDKSMPLPVARFGDSDELVIGDTVMAMGSPWALSRSVSMGIVSNTERILATRDDDTGELQFDENQRTGLFNRWIQHDAAINPGNSGGPLVNLKGEIVGVNTRGMIIGGDMGFAIPSNIAKSVAAALIEHGEVPRSSFGLTLKPVKRMGRERGVLINSIDREGPAAAAGLHAGDVILAIDGEPVTALHGEQVPPILKRLADFPIGAEVKIRYERDGQELETTLTTVKLKRDAGEEAAFRGWGLTAQDITEKMARDRRLASTLGVLVTGVRPGSSAQLAEPPLADGDVIRRLDGRPVENLDQFVEQYNRIMDAEALPEYLVVEFERLGKNHVTLLKPKPDEDEPPPRELPKAWVGVAVQPVVQKLAEQLGHPDQIGFRITRVYPGTKAAGTELRVGDLITHLDGEPLRPVGMQDADLFHRLVRRLDIDGQVTLTVFRPGEAESQGESLQISVPLERTRIQPSEAPTDRNRTFELFVREVTFFDRDENRWDADTSGVIVVQLEPAGWAGLGGLRARDLIQRIGDTPIRDLADYRRVMKRIEEEQPERIEFVVLRGVRTHFQYIEPDWSPTVGDAESGEKEE